MTRNVSFPRPALAAALGIALALAPAVQAQNTAATRVAVINVVQLLEESDPGKQGLEELKTLQQQKKEQRDALQADAKQLNEQITQGQFSLSEEKLSELQRQLEQKGIELQRFNDDANRELQDKQTQMLTSIQNMVMPIIAEVGKEGGYTMIFNKFESGLVYADEAIDITSQVMQRLNDAAKAGATATEPGS